MGLAVVAIIFSTVGAGLGVYHTFFAVQPQTTPEDPVPGIFFCSSGLELQAVLNTIGSGNGIITITQDITTSATIVINGGGDYIIQGAGDVLVTIQGSKPILNITRTSNCIIRDLTINGSAIISQWLPLIEIDEIAGNPVYVENVHIFGFNRKGIGIRIYSGNVRVKDCLFDNLYDGLNITSCVSLNVFQNTFENIHEYAIRGGNVTESHFEGNRLTLCDSGMFFQSSSSQNSIKNNIICNFTLSAICLRESNQTIISGNTVCMDNDVNTPTFISGIYLLESCGYDIISGNMVCNITNAGAGDGYGILLIDTNCVNNLISGNMVCGNDVNLYYYPGNTIVDNVVG